MVSVSYSGMRLKQKGRGFDPHSVSQCCVLEQDWIGVNTFHNFDSGKQRSFFTFRNRGGGGGGGGGGGAVADPEGVQGVRSNPPLELNYFIFMGNFRKNEATLKKTNPPF